VIKLIGYTPTGGRITITQLERSGVTGGAKDLAQAEFDAYKKAKLQADMINGGDIDKAKATLEAAGFEVYLEGYADELMTARLQVVLPPTLKDYIMANGGSDFVRQLVQAHRERQEATESGE
jgi:hypothetical protein